jgi:hypothetical protein
MFSLNCLKFGCAKVFHDSAGEKPQVLHQKIRYVISNEIQVHLLTSSKQWSWAYLGQNGICDEWLLECDEDDNEDSFLKQMDSIVA